MSKNPPPSPVEGRASTNASEVANRPKVLCLGMSYTSMAKQLAACEVDFVEWFAESDSNKVEPLDVVRAVQQGYLTQMDGRDLARCIASEQACDVDIYTVSQEKAAVYETNRHLEANFCRHQFLPQLHVAFARDQQGNKQAEGVRRGSFDTKYVIQFRQVVLDYFWIPQGWDDTHWTPSFFAEILKGIVDLGMLDMDDSQELPCAVYLPFCFHCFRQVINALNTLRKYYAISFLSKHELEEVTLWKGTQSIDAVQMQTQLGKQRDQEEVYCTFGYREVMGAGTGVRDETKDVLIDYLSQLEDFNDIRFIKLRPLQQHHSTRSIPSDQHETGGLQGLNDSRQVKRGLRMKVDQVNQVRRANSTALLANPCAKKGLKAEKKTKGKGQVEVQQKIISYLGQELQADRKDVTKQEVVEGSGFTKAQTGKHTFFNAWKDLERTKEWVRESSSGKGYVCLTDAGKQQFFKEALLKACKEARAEKVEIIFDIFKDGKPHHLDEFTKATGYVNMRSKGLGYPFSHMQKKMKIVEKCGDKMYRFTDKCFSGKEAATTPHSRYRASSVSKPVSRSSALPTRSSPSAKSVRTATRSPTSVVMTDAKVKPVSNAENAPSAARRSLDLNQPEMDSGSAQVTVASSPSVSEDSTKMAYPANESSDANCGPLSNRSNTPQVRRAQGNQVSLKSSTTLAARKKSTATVQIINGEEQRDKCSLTYFGTEAATTTHSRSSASKPVSRSSALPTRSSQCHGTFVSLPDGTTRKRRRTTASSPQTTAMLAMKQTPDKASNRASSPSKPVSRSSALPTRSSRCHGTFVSLPDKTTRKRRRITASSPPTKQKPDKASNTFNRHIDKGLMWEHSSGDTVGVQTLVGSQPSARATDLPNKGNGKPTTSRHAEPKGLEYTDAAYSLTLTEPMTTKALPVTATESPLNSRSRIAKPKGRFRIGQMYSPGCSVPENLGCLNEYAERPLDAQRALFHPSLPSSKERGLLSDASAAFSAEKVPPRLCTSPSSSTSSDTDSNDSSAIASFSGRNNTMHSDTLLQSMGEHCGPRHTPAVVGALDGVTEDEQVRQSALILPSLQSLSSSPKKKEGGKREFANTDCSYADTQRASRNPVGWSYTPASGMKAAVCYGCNFLISRYEGRVTHNTVRERGKHLFHATYHYHCRDLCFRTVDKEELEKMTEIAWKAADMNNLIERIATLN